MRLVPSSKHHYSLRFPYCRTKLLHCEFTSCLINLSIPFFFILFVHITRPFALQPRDEEEEESSKGTLLEINWLPPFPRLVLSRAQTIPSVLQVQRQHRLLSRLLQNTGYSIHALLRAALLSRCSTYTRLTRPPFSLFLSYSTHKNTTRLLVFFPSSSSFFGSHPPLFCFPPIKSNQTPQTFLALLFFDSEINSCPGPCEASHHPPRLHKQGPGLERLRDCSIAGLTILSF